MEGNEDIQNNKKNKGLTNGITKVIQTGLSQLEDNITILDLSNRKISTLEDSISLPPNTTHLNISHNQFVELPPAVLNLEKLIILDVSYNNIAYFDNAPNFTHTIEQLNLSQNKLEGPPYWVWSESPKNLSKLNLSWNNNICLSFVDGYFEELSTYTTSVKEIDIYNCRLDKYIALLATFKNAKVINLGTNSYNYCHINYLKQLPCKGLDQCCDVERLNVANTNIYTINSNIDIYKNLIEINLSNNNIYSLPNEFCNLLNLEICILSFNRLMYFPEDMYKLTELCILLVDNNELCMLPGCINDLSKLRILDIYNNKLHEQIDVKVVKDLDKVDMAFNYFEEPTYTEYQIRKERLRLNLELKTKFERNNGSRPPEEDCESERSQMTSDDEINALMSNGDIYNYGTPESIPSPASSPEDWDSDAYWIPRYYTQEQQPISPWIHYVKRKMAEGNFCPMDAHTVSITEQVRYEKLCNPQEQHESDGQFDDYSDDDS